MSIIAWDGTTIAADRQATHSGLALSVEKLYRRSAGVILGFTGSLEQGLLLADWYGAGADPDKWPVWQTPMDYTRLVVLNFHVGLLMEYESLPVAQYRKFESPAAFGSGRDFALGAMAQGANAREAVEIASRFSVDCGLGVTSFSST